MSKIKGIIFDLDGVLVSTEINHFISWKKIANELNISFNEIDNEKLKGLSREDSLKEILSIGNKTTNHTTFKQLLELKNKHYIRSIENINQNNLLPGVLEFIKLSFESGLLLAVGSSSKNAHYILDKIKLKDYFKCIIDGNMVKDPKPNPEVFTNAAIGLNLKNNECIVFEDSLSGIMAAKSGGFYVVGVRNRNIMEDCDYFVENINEFDLNTNAKSI